MALQDIPVYLGGYRLLVTEAPCAKMRELENGDQIPGVERRNGAEQYGVVVFPKPQQVRGRRQGKGEEIKVNLPTDPGEGFDEGTYVELVNAVINTYEM